MPSVFDRAVSNLMSKFGTTAYITVAISSNYNPDTSENTVLYNEYPVNAMFFDFIDKKSGVGTESNSLIQTGDKQVLIQPPQKMADGFSIPHIAPNKDFLKLNGRLYKIITVKQYNPSMTNQGCVLYELYIRE